MLTPINGSYCSFISVSMATVWRETGEEDQGAAVWSLLDLIKAPELSGGVQVEGRQAAHMKRHLCLVSFSDQNSLDHIRRTFTALVSDRGRGHCEDAATNQSK